MTRNEGKTIRTLRLETYLDFFRQTQSYYCFILVICTLVIITESGLHRLISFSRCRQHKITGVKFFVCVYKTWPSLINQPIDQLIRQTQHKATSFLFLDEI